jgi:hypothetical protein
VLEGLLWLLPAVGFVAAAGLLVANVEGWRGVALVAAILSLVVIALFPQQLSFASLIGALVVDAAVLIGLLLLQWPAAEAVGA